MAKRAKRSFSKSAPATTISNYPLIIIERESKIVR